MRIRLPPLLLTTLIPQALSAARRPMNLFLDFDGTIALNDTLTALATTAYDSARPEELAAKNIPPWSYFGDVYMQEYDAYSAGYPPRGSLKQEVRFRASEGLREVESRSYERVRDSGVFNYVKEEVFAQYAAAVALRPGLKRMLEVCKKERIPVRIVSVNWSPKWIRRVLEAGVGKGLVDDVEIYCSEIIPEEILPSHSRDRPTRLHTGGDKVELVARVMGKTKGMIIFVGDSKSDLPPLVQADFGIVTAGDSSLASSLEVWETEKWKLTSKTLKKHKSGLKGLFVIDTWDEIVETGLLQGKH